MNKVKQLWYKLDGRKSYITAITTILYAIIYYGLSQHQWGTAVDLILGASGLGALRSAVSKAE